MKNFEYKFYKNILNESSLNKLGLKGWELVFLNPKGESVFKREIEKVVKKDLDLLNDQFSDEITLEKIK